MTGGLAAPYDSAPCGLATIDRSGEFLRANAMMRVLLGADQEAALPNFFGTLRPGDRIFWETHVGPLLEMQRHVREIAVEVGTGDQSTPVLLNARIDVPGVPSGSIDIALFPARDRRSYERELLDARRRAEESEARANDLASTLQQSLLPPALPSIPGIELAAEYRPAGVGLDVGGDFYDFFRIDDKDWFLVMGDVCGKGAHAAATTALVRFTLRGAAMETDDLQEVLRGVNNALRLDTGNHLCTVLLARLRPSERGHSITLAVAGHPRPRRVSGGTVTEVGATGTVLGVTDEVSHPLEAIELGPGDTLVLFTDGVTEARHGDDFFGLDRLDDVLERVSTSRPGTVVAAVVEAAFDFQDGTPRDDIAVMAISGSTSRPD